MSAHFHLTQQDGRTMLDYAIIGAKNEEIRNDGEHDKTIAFLQSCSSELNLAFLFHILVIISPLPEL